MRPLLMPVKCALAFALSDGWQFFECTDRDSSLIKEDENITILIFVVAMPNNLKIIHCSERSLSLFNLPVVMAKPNNKPKHCYGEA